jgi:hypothetical protein
MQIAAPIQRCFDLSRSIEVHLLGTEKTGEQTVAGVRTGLVGPDEFVRWRAKHLGVRQHLTSKITAFDSPNYFQDTMIEVAFKFMQHDHFFSQTEMRDRSHLRPHCRCLEASQSNCFSDVIWTGFSDGATKF